ncbi:uncharacterized protein [Nicotiana tomentosiformis]|uniref:uncharacterized protein n=1 Tax=Nicotiana tomentosiformis TaxID=4098 RepID=UPI00388C6069
MRLPLPRCAQCGKQYVGQCLVGLGVCYTCGYPDHVMRDGPTRGGAGTVQPEGFVAGSSSSVRALGRDSQTPISRGRGRGGASRSSGPQNRIYALAAPLTKLTQKAVEFQWTDFCERNFNLLENRLNSASVLTLPEVTDGYAIYCVTSGVGLGCVLMPQGDTEVTIRDIAKSSLVTEVKEHKYEDPLLAYYRDTTSQKEKMPFEITEDGISYEEAPIAILDRQIRRLRTKDVASVKILWRNKNMEEMTWEAEEDMKTS